MYSFFIIFLSHFHKLSNRIGLVWWTSTVIFLTGDLRADAATLLGDAILEPEALNFARGTYGTCINGQTFQIDAVASLKGWQYGTWFDAKGRLCVGRRQLPVGVWQRLAFDDYRITHTDVHNVAVLGLCPADGTIHLAFDHHGSPLHYRVSRPGTITAPAQADWSPSLFSPVTAELVKGHALNALTYPEFFATPDGRLQLYYRIGGSGNGDSHLAEYNPGKGGWTVKGVFVSSNGTYEGSRARNAYHNGFDYGPKGRLHTTWVWREMLDNGQWGLLNCHGLQYAFSDDDGQTWYNNALEKIGVVKQDPVHLESTKIMVKPLAYRWGIMNQVTQIVDGRDRVHVVMWQNPPGAPAGSKDMNTWRYTHYWRDEKGQWHEQQLPFFGRKPFLLADAEDNLVLVYTKPANLEYHGADVGGPLHIATASAKREWNDRNDVYSSANSFVGEPRVDKYRWQKERVLSVYTQEAPLKPGQPSRLHVLDFKP